MGIWLGKPSLNCFAGGGFIYATDGTRGKETLTGSVSRAGFYIFLYHKLFKDRVSYIINHKGGKRG